MATAPLIHEGRRVTRDIVSFRTTLDSPTGLCATVLMVDISPLGFMSRTDAPMMPGERIAVKLPLIGPRAATVRWAIGGRVGGEFVEPIPPSLYARLLATMPNDRPNWTEF